MSDPHIPVERGLRATVRMAAGINIGDGDDGESGIHRAMTRLRAALPRWEAAAARLTDGLVAIEPAILSRSMRHGALGAVAGVAIVGAGLVAIAAQAAVSAEPTPHEQILTAVEPLAKGDRATVGGFKLASIASAVEVPTPRQTDITITTPSSDPDTTVAMPILAFASAELRDGGALSAIDRVLDAPPIAAATPGYIAEEEDDEQVVPLALPLPRARPMVEVSPLPMPKPRPRLASLTPPGVDDGATEEAPPRRAAAPTQEPPGNVLGFFSSPTEPVKPPSTMKIDTPFGVPYVLQTGSVETACLKPELVEILRRIEGHYNHKVVITSGFRDRGRQGSLHRTCAAVDIEVPGVDAASLATYARTIPGIGGVGTYCYPRLIHVDIGTPRDWKYGCGSFFAMRGGPGKWGKVPGTLAKARTGGPIQTANDASGEE